MRDETLIGGRAGEFPATRRSALRAAASADPETRRQAFDAIVAAYWKPVYKYLRLQWREPNEGAKDLTQGFFAQALEKGWLSAWDPARARFRTWLRTCLDGFVANERKAAGRLKRGGGARTLPLDFEGAEAELPHSRERPPDDLFEREWIRGLFQLAVEELRRDAAAGGRDGAFRLFERYDLDDAGGRLTYDDLAREAGVPVTTVTNQLAAMRRAFRQIVLDRLRELTGSEEEFRAEARAVLGIDPR
jgi:DNA-directed RNA polymerase specialized sigma24 family protein